MKLSVLAASALLCAPALVFAAPQRQAQADATKWEPINSGGGSGGQPPKSSTPYAVKKNATQWQYDPAVGG